MSVPEAGRSVTPAGCRGKERSYPTVNDGCSGLVTWIEIDAKAIESNIAGFRRRLRTGTGLQAVVKSNAYGHGLEPVARIAARAGVDSFGVHTIEEAETVARLDLGRPILILGFVATSQASRAAACGTEVTLYNLATAEALSAAGIACGRTIRCHVKVETGVYRQGIPIDELDAFLDRAATLPGIRVAGVSTHFANIEDTTDHSFAKLQLERFRAAADRIRVRFPDAIRHCACSAAVLTMPETDFDMVRVGIGIYGLWPSKETLLSCLLEGKGEAPLAPAMVWKCRIAQVKEAPTGATVGYGCTFRTTHPTRIAVIPVGYADGYDRRLSGIGTVLIRGRRAQVLGRICMNLFMVDVTDIIGVELEEEAVLLGKQAGDEISASHIATLCNTIPYEIVSRVSPHIPRIVTNP
jgi:alanine racemase